MPSNESLGSQDIRSLFRKDVCSDTFPGEDRTNAICAPNNTLCCVIRNKAFPSCHHYLGRGWCCVGENPTDHCYVDTPSVCDEPNSVPCTNLAKGTKQACCPRLTSCHDPFEATAEFVRCNIYHDDLKILALAESALLASQSSIPTTSSISTTIISSSSSTTAGISTTTTSFATAESSRTSNSNSSSTSMTEPTITGTTNKPSTTGNTSPAFIAGVLVGPILGIIALVVLGWWFFFARRRQMQPTLPKKMEQQEEIKKLGQDVQLVEGHGPQYGMIGTHPGLVEVDGSQLEGGNHESSELWA
ncbi:hypothetical protein QBC43DRAFT_284769 [Cladorrhinum sp. PSN259]|nr:hypothetical protein QBC43DRAFT_284769 [Cladorrhinum sp. PSN259]